MSGRSPDERFQLVHERLVLCGRVHLAARPAQLAMKQLAVCVDLERRGAPGPTNDPHCRAKFCVQLALQMVKGRLVAQVGALSVGMRTRACSAAEVGVGWHANAHTLSSRGRFDSVERESTQFDLL